MATLQQLTGATKRRRPSSSPVAEKGILLHTAPRPPTTGSTPVRALRENEKSEEELADDTSDPRDVTTREWPLQRTKKSGGSCRRGRGGNPLRQKGPYLSPSLDREG